MRVMKAESQGSNEIEADTEEDSDGQSHDTDAMQPASWIVGLRPITDITLFVGAVSCGAVDLCTNVNGQHIMEYCLKNFDDKHKRAFLKAWRDVCGSTQGTPTLIIPKGSTFLLNSVEFQGPCRAASVNFQVHIYDAFIAAVDKGNIRTMPNRSMPAAPYPTPAVPSQPSPKRRHEAGSRSLPVEKRFNAYFMEEMQSWMLMSADWLAVVACSSAIFGVVHTSNHHRRWIWFSFLTGIVLAVFWLYYMFSGARLCLYVDHQLLESSEEIRKLRGYMYAYKAS